METMKQFKAGSKYYCRSICDHNCIWYFDILKRTDKSVWVEVDNKIVRRSLRVWGGSEQFNPFGSYSMAPIVTAEKTA